MVHLLTWLAVGSSPGTLPPWRLFPPAAWPAAVVAVLAARGRVISGSVTASSSVEAARRRRWSQRSAVAAVILFEPPPPPVVGLSKSCWLAVSRLATSATPAESAPPPWWPSPSSWRCCAWLWWLLRWFPVAVASNLVMLLLEVGLAVLLLWLLPLLLWLLLWWGCSPVSSSTRLVRCRRLLQRIAARGFSPPTCRSTWWELSSSTLPVKDSWLLNDQVGESVLILN